MGHKPIEPHSSSQPAPHPAPVSASHSASSSTAVSDNLPAPSLPLLPLEPESATPEEAVLVAMGAYDNFARRIVMSNRGSLTKSQADVVMGLALFGKMSMTQVSEHLAASKEQATRAVAPLVERGFVKRTRNEQNYRIIEVSLTKEGMRQFEASRALLIEGIRNRLSRLSEEDRIELMKASRAAESILRKLHGQ